MAADDLDRKLRRSTDRWTDERIDDAMARIENELHILSPLPNAIGKLEVRVERAIEDIAKIDIAAALTRVERQIDSIHGKLDADMEALKETFIPRSEMPALYVPRKEHERRLQMRLQWPTIALAVIMIVSQMVILLRAIH